MLMLTVIDDRYLNIQAIFNGEDAEYRPYHMFVSSSEPGHAFGSGIMISRRHVLTSATLISGYDLIVNHKTVKKWKLFS